MHPCLKPHDTSNESLYPAPIYLYSQLTSKYAAFRKARTWPPIHIPFKHSHNFPRSTLSYAFLKSMKLTNISFLTLPSSAPAISMSLVGLCTLVPSRNLLAPLPPAAFLPPYAPTFCGPCYTLSCIQLMLGIFCKDYLPCTHTASSSLAPELLHFSSTQKEPSHTSSTN